MTPESSVIPSERDRTRSGRPSVVEGSVVGWASIGESGSLHARNDRLGQSLHLVGMTGSGGLAAEVPQRLKPKAIKQSGGCPILSRFLRKAGRTRLPTAGFSTTRIVSRSASLEMTDYKKWKRWSGHSAWQSFWVKQAFWPAIKVDLDFRL